MPSTLSRKLSPRRLDARLLTALLFVLVAAVGCNTAEKQAAEQEAARDARLAELQEQQAELEAMRSELAELKAEMVTTDEDGAEDAPAEGEEAEGSEAATGEDPAARIEQLENQIQSESEEFYNALVTFINENPPVEGEPLNERQETAIRMKSQEDILVAREYVEKGGDYRRAIDILNTALMVDPDNEVLQEALADVEAKRYMTEERLAQVEKGMNRDEVREILGTPYHANVRTFEEDGVVAWFYPVDPRGSAAAVWFRQKDEDYEAYEINFEEVVKEGPEEAGGEAEAS